MANVLSFFLLLLLFYGRSLRHKNKKQHALVMSFVIFMDISLVIALIVMRNAIEQIDTQMHWSLMLHLPFSTATFILYFVALYVGFKLLKGEKRFRKHMRILDRLILPGRTLTLLTSLLVQYFKGH